MGSTTLYGLRYPEYAAGADPKLDIQKLAEDVAPRLHQAEPRTASQITAIASPRIGQLVLNTDAGRVLFWNGTVWRPVGGGASGTVVIGSVSITTTTQTLAYFIGLGFEEVQFSINSGLGPGTTSFGFNLTAFADATRAQGIGTTASAAYVFAPASTADIITGSITNNASGAVALNIRNVRLDSDGYLRFEVLTSGTAATTVSTTRMNWRAR